MAQKFFILLFAICSPTFAHATIHDFHHKLGGIIDYWNYEEPGVMKDTGALIGVEYEMRNLVFDDLLYYQFNGEVLAGRTNYEGADLNTGTPLTFTQTNSMGMIQLYVGTAINAASSSLLVIPKIGFLYRTFTDNDDEFLGDYQRDQEYKAFPVGIDVMMELSNGAELTLGGLFTTTFSGKNKTYFSDVGGAEDLTFKQDSGRGLQLSGTYAQDWWYASVVIRTWKVDASEVKSTIVPSVNNGAVTQFLEPTNETLSYGARFGWRF